MNIPFRHGLCFLLALGAGIAACRAEETQPVIPPKPIEKPLPPVLGEKAQPLPEWARTPAPEAQETTDPAALELLGRLEAKSQEVRTFTAKLRYDRIQGLVGDRQRRFGTLYYLAGPPAQFAAHLEKRLVDRRLDEQNRWYIFDGVWLVEKIADQKPKQFLKRQVVSPDADPAQVNPLALGSGPFVLPIDMKKDVVLARFVASVVPVDPAGGEPGASIHLRLIPKSHQKLDASQIDVWYHQDTLLPLRVRSLEKDSENESVIDLSEPAVNQEIDPGIINTSEPKEEGWDVTVTPWENR